MAPASGLLKILGDFPKFGVLVKGGYRGYRLRGWGDRFFALWVWLGWPSPSVGVGVGWDQET